MWDLGTVLGRAWEIFQANVGIVILGYGLVFGANFIVQLPANLSDQVLPILLQQASGDAVALLTMLFGIMQIILGFLAFLVRVYFGLGLTRMMLHLARGEPASLEDFVTPTSMYFSALLAAFLTGLATVVGGVMCIVPGVVVALGFFMWEYVMVDQDLSPIDALKESWRLTHGEKAQLFVFAIVSIVLFLMGLLMCCLGLIVTVPLCGIAVALIYDDMVQRKGTAAQMP